MRPKKRVLLAGANETAVGIRKFTLETWGYAVITAESAAGVTTALRARPVDLVVAWDPECVDAARAVQCDVPVLQVAGAEASSASVFERERKLSPETMRWRVRELTSLRKPPRSVDVTQLRRARPATPDPRAV